MQINPRNKPNTSPSEYAILNNINDASAANRWGGNTVKNDVSPSTRSLSDFPFWVINTHDWLSCKPYAGSVDG